MFRSRGHTPVFYLLLHRKAIIAKLFWRSRITLSSAETSVITIFLSKPLYHNSHISSSQKGKNSSQAEAALIS